VDPEFQVVNQNKLKVVMPASFLNNQSAGTVLFAFILTTIEFDVLDQTQINMDCP
jgi:hypothetical protein